MGLGLNGAVVAEDIRATVVTGKKAVALAVAESLQVSRHSNKGVSHNTRLDKVKREALESNDTSNGCISRPTLLDLVAPHMDKSLLPQEHRIRVLPHIHLGDCVLPFFDAGHPKNQGSTHHSDARISQAVIFARSRLRHEN
jgi:hypothetical protein